GRPARRGRPVVSRRPPRQAPARIQRQDRGAVPDGAVRPGAFLRAARRQQGIRRRGVHVLRGSHRLAFRRRSLKEATCKETMMSKNRLLFVSSAIAVALAAGCVSKGDYEKLQAERDGLDQRVKELESQRAGLENQQTALRSEVVTLEK